MPATGVVTTGVPTMSASVAAVENPSAIDEQINMSHFETYLYGFL